MDMVVLGLQLELILKDFYTLDDSMILLFSNHRIGLGENTCSVSALGLW